MAGPHNPFDDKNFIDPSLIKPAAVPPAKPHDAIDLRIINGTKQVMEETAACLHHDVIAPTQRRNITGSPYEAMIADPNSGPKGFYGGVKLTIPFSTGGYQGLRTEASHLSLESASTGSGSTLACVITSALQTAAPPIISTALNHVIGPEKTAVIMSKVRSSMP